MSKNRQETGEEVKRAAALRLVVLLGMVSLFADMTYEAARSISGPYLGLLGASGTIVGIVAGFGELVGYALRLVSGIIADKTGKYWTITLLGYAVNMIAVPLLALAGHWELAAFFMVSERLGKAIRTPARDAMLSHATATVGRGWGFGLHEAMDQIGAIVGPLLITAVFYFNGTYQTGFAVLTLPALLAMGTLFMARRLYPNPRDLEIAIPDVKKAAFPREFRLYLAAAVSLAAGYADFPLIAYHFKTASVAPEVWIPSLYAVAMGVDALAALIFGWLFDRAGLVVLMIAILISAPFALFVFRNDFGAALVGMMLWGVGLGAQESIMRATIGGMVSADQRATAYGVFNAGFGLSWFFGSAVMGWLYDASLVSLVAFSVGTQLLAVPLLVVSKMPAKSAS